MSLDKVNLAAKLALIEAPWQPRIVARRVERPQPV